MCAFAVQLLHHLVRFRKETWIEIWHPGQPASCSQVRLRKETWIEILIGSTFNPLAIQFVSLRRRELKSTKRVHQTWLRGVRLLTETWVEIFWSNSSHKFVLRSSPYRDVNWNVAALMPQERWQTVRLLAETWVEIKTATLQSCITTFVSLRRRELKWDHQSRGRVHQGSSPYGDVSWNSIAN